MKHGSPARLAFRQSSFSESRPQVSGQRMEQESGRARIAMRHGCASAIGPPYDG